MSVSFECPSCERKLKAPEKLIGKRLQCPSCFNEVIVPDGSGQEDYSVDSDDPMPMPSRRRASNSSSTRPQVNQTTKAPAEQNKTSVGSQRVRLIASATGLGGFLLGVLVMWLAGRNVASPEALATQSAPALVESEPDVVKAGAKVQPAATVASRTPEGAATVRASTEVEVPTEPGYGNDLPQVIESAIKDLEAGEVRQFVLRVFPPEAIADMLKGPPGKTRLDSVNQNSTLIIRMREDLKTLRTVRA